jgi:hypothetical protein
MMSNIDRFYCQNSLIICRLMHILEIGHSKTWIKERLKAFDTYPKVSVNNLADVLRTCGIHSSAIKTKPETLRRLEFPFIAYIGNNSINRYFVIVKWINEDKISYYSADEGDVVEYFADFIEIWTGIVILIGAENCGDSKASETYFDSELSVRYRENYIRQIPNFLSDVECQQVIDYSERLGGYSHSKIIGKEGEATVDDTRTSYSINLPYDAIPLFTEIRGRVASFLNVPDSHIEGLQCVRYSEGQQFAPHLDSNDRLNRKHTILVYLNDDFAGGETYFPELLLKIAPVKGKALYFQNEDEDGCAIPFSIHAGLRLKSGVKYACNIWVKDRAAL